MDLQTRKLDFIQEILKLEDEEVINRLEKVLEDEREPASTDADVMSKEELSRRIDQSEKDFKNKRFKVVDSILEKYK